MTRHADVALAGLVASAADRTVAAGTARLFSATCEGSPVPQPGDRCYDGVVDFAHRRADVIGHPVPERLMPEGIGDKLAGLASENPEMHAVARLSTERHRTVYDGARGLSRVGDQWFGWLGDADDPRDCDDPLWPLDALFGANDDVIEADHEPLRDADTIRCRLTLDLLRADERLPAGVTVPNGPLRRLRQLPAEVWLDASGHPRRIAVALVSSSAGRPRRPWIWEVTELWDFGVDVTITPPSPDEVYEIDWRAIGSSR